MESGGMSVIFVRIVVRVPPREYDQVGPPNVRRRLLSCGFATNTSFFLSKTSTWFFSFFQEPFSRVNWAAITVFPQGYSFLLIRYPFVF